MTLIKYFLNGGYLLKVYCKYFVNNGFVQKNKWTLDKQLGSFREIEKVIVLKNNEKNYPEKTVILLLDEQIFWNIFKTM